MEKRIEISGEANARLHTTAAKLEVKTAELMTRILTVAASMPADRIVRWMKEGLALGSPAQLLEHAAGVLEGLEADAKTEAENKITAIHLRKLATANEAASQTEPERERAGSDVTNLRTLADMRHSIPETLDWNGAVYVRADLIMKQCDRWGLDRDVARRARARIRDRDHHIEIERFVVPLKYGSGRPRLYIRLDAVRLAAMPRMTGGGEYSRLSTALCDLTPDDIHVVAKANAIPDRISHGQRVFIRVDHPPTSMMQWIGQHGTPDGLAFRAEVCGGAHPWYLYWLEEQTYAD